MLSKIIWICAAVLLLIVVSGTGAALTDNEQLGKSIFFDEDLSINKNQACAACHAPNVGWTGPDSKINDHGAVYEGSIADRFGNRKPPSAAYATPSPIFHATIVGKKDPLFVGGNFWDGRATGEKLGNPAADQAQGPFLNPAEHALPDSACVVYRVFNGGYPVPYETVWGTISIIWPDNIETICAKEDETVLLSIDDRARSDLAYDNIALSIAAYEGSPEVNQFTSKYDYSLMAKVKLTKQEQKGFALFQGKGKCNRCHVSSGKKPLFTDFTFDNLGIPQNPENPSGVKPDFVDPGLGGFLLNRPEWAHYAAINEGKHKVPTLRNVDLRPNKGFVKAYGHNGYFKSLEEIVHFYNTRDVPGAGWNGVAWPAPEVPQNVNTAELGNLGLKPQEEAAIVAFLKTLSDGYIPQK